jgi:hypothetical protein
MANLPTQTKGNRIDFLDNLRTTIICLVILYHAGGVYEATGIWAAFWIVDDPAINNASGLVGLIVDVFVMSTLFFISGYLAPASLQSRQGWAFIKAKFFRLMLPWIIAVLTLIPLYKAIFLFSRNLPQEKWITYFHFSSGNISSQNWLWFLPVLFLFNILYLLLTQAQLKISNISLKGALLTIFLIGFVYSLSMDLLGLRGWTLTPLLDFQNERVLIYFMFFLLGVLSFRLKLFEVKEDGKAVYTIVNTIGWIPLNVYIFFLLFPLFRPGHFIVSKIIDRSIIWFCFHLSLFYFVYVMIETFRRYVNKSGELWRILNQNSYYVYIIHVIVMGGIATFLLDSAMHSLAKHLVLTASTFVSCNVLVYYYRRFMHSLRQFWQRTRQLSRIKTV